MSHPEMLADIAILVAVVDAGSFTLASGKLALSKSMVSKCVNRLESALGARLLHRTTRRLHLTEAGSALYETSRGALSMIEDAQLAISKLQGAPRGLLKVTASPAFGTVVLPPVAARLMEEHPDLKVELLLEDRHIDLVREGVDVALRITGETPDSSMVYRRLGPNRQVVCASPAYLARRGVPRNPLDLKAHQCIAHTQRATPRVWHFTTPTGGKTSVPIEARLAVTTSLALRSCALEGIGVVEVNSYIVAADIQAGRLVRLLEGYEPKALSVYAVFPERRFLAPKVRVFIDAMLAIMTPKPYWDAFFDSRAATSPRGSRNGRRPRRR